MENLLIYGSIFDIVEGLSNEEAGLLFKALNDWRKGNKVTFDDRYLQGIWIGILPNLESLKNNYEKKVINNRENGKKGGRPKNQMVINITQDNPENPDGFLITQDNPENLKEKEKDKDKEKEKQQPLHITTLIDSIDDEEYQIFDDIWKYFEDDIEEYENIFNLFWSLPIQDQEKIMLYAEKYSDRQKRKKQTAKLFWFITDKKYNWESLKN